MVHERISWKPGYQKNYYYHVSQEFDANILQLVKKKRFLPYDYWDSFGSKINFIIYWLKVKLVMKIMNILSSFGK